MNKEITIAAIFIVAIWMLLLTGTMIDNKHEEEMQKLKCEQYEVEIVPKENKDGNS